MMLIIMLLVHAVKERHSSVHVRRNFRCLIMASTKLNYYAYARSLFCKQIVRKRVSAPLSFFIPPFLRNMQSPFPSWHVSRENTRLYDDTLESGRLKTINIKPWKPITYRNLSTECLLIDIIVKISISLRLKLAPSPITDHSLDYMCIRLFRDHDAFL